MKLFKRDSVSAIIITVLVLWLIFAGCTDITPTPTTSPPVTPTPPVSPLAPAVVEFPVQTKTEEPMPDFLIGLLNFCMNAGLPLILALCVADIGFGVGAALKSKEFDWGKLGDFYVTQILSLLVPYVAVLAALALVPGLVDFLPAVAAPAGLLAGIVAKLGGSIIKSAGSLTGS